MEICRKWHEKAFELTEKLVIEKTNLSSSDFSNKNRINELNLQSKELKIKIKEIENEIENSKLQESALCAAISHHTKSLDELTNALDSANKQLVPFIEIKSKHLDNISNLQTPESIIRKINESIDDDKILQMKHLVDLITIIKKREQEYKRKKTEADNRNEYIATLKELSHARDENYKASLQWKAIEAELQEDNDEKGRLDVLKNKYSALLQKGKSELSEYQNELTKVYDEAREKRDNALMKQRDLEKKVKEAQKNFEETQETKQDQVDELSKHIADQKEEIEQLKNQIEETKEAISKRIDEGINCDPPRSPIFDDFQIDDNILNMPNLGLSGNDIPQQTENKPSKIIDDDNSCKDLLDKINELMKVAQDLTLD